MNSLSKGIKDRCHCTHSLPPILENIEVQIISGSSPTSSRVTANAGAPHPYIVNTLQGEIRRNWLHLNVVLNGDPPTQSRTDADTSQEISDCPVTSSVTGTVIRPPDRLAYCLKEGRCGIRLNNSIYVVTIF